jgi:hypothetical protein
MRRAGAGATLVRNSVSIADSQRNMNHTLSDFHVHWNVTTNALIVTVLLTLTASSWAGEDPRYAAVKALGELNGVALQCRYIDQVRRMKAAVVAHAPKERSFGQAFDQATNDAFLAFIKDRKTCPNHDGFTRRIGQQIEAMRVFFAAR